MFVSLIISYCVILNLTNETKIRCLANIYILSAIVMGIQLWATGQLDYLFILTEFGPATRFGVDVTGNANIFSALFMYAGVLASWLIVYTPRNLQKLVYIILLCAILFLMAVSGGRKTIVAVVATFALFFFFKRDSKYRTHYGRNFALAALVVIGIFFAIFNIPFLYGVVGERFEGMFEMFGGGGAVVAGDDMRDWMIGRAFNGWLEAPFFGHGIDSFKYYNQIETGHHFYAHNNILELLFDVGIVGFVVYYWIFYYLLKKLFQLPAQLYAYRVLGYGLLFEIFIFDFGGISYYLVGSIITLAICFCCCRLKA